MKTIVWKPQRRNLSPKDVHEIMGRCLEAGLPMESAAQRQQGVLLNFKDGTDDLVINQAIQIAEAYDPDAAAATKKAAKTQWASDIRPFKNIQALLEDNLRDVQAVKGATLDQLQTIVGNMLARESIILRGLARLLEHTPLEDDE